MLRTGLVSARHPNEGIIDRCMAAFTNYRTNPHSSSTIQSCQAGRQTSSNSSFTLCGTSMVYGRSQDKFPSLPTYWDSSPLPAIRHLKRQRRWSPLASASGPEAEASDSIAQPSQEILGAWHAVNTVLFNFNCT
jgi:hypothetical protein